jgi:hypothetical protein
MADILIVNEVESEQAREPNSKTGVARPEIPDIAFRSLQ